MAAPEPYRTVDGRASTGFVVQGSRFLGHLAPADDVSGAEAFVAEVEAEYDDATHNVPAYRVPAGTGASISSESSYSPSYYK